jgi:hypothetical protein
MSRPAVHARASLGTLAAMAFAAHAQDNLSFELGGDAAAGWRVAGEDERSVRAAPDSSIAKDGVRSLRILGDGGIVRVTQRIPVERSHGANRVELSGYVRAFGAVDASLWLRVDGPGGFLAIDSRNAGGAQTSDGWTRYAVQLPLPDDAEEIVIGLLLRDGGTAWFDALALEFLNARTLPAPSATARRYVAAALDVMHEHSINRSMIDWSAFRAAALEQARGAVTTTDAQLAVRFALRELGDHHSYLVTPSTAAALSITPVSNARTGRSSIPPRAERLDGVGYLALPGFAGGTQAAQVAFANEIQNLIEELDSAGVYGWILDLRRNSGGNLWPMLAGIGPLLGAGEAGASVYPDGRESPYWYEDGKAGFGDYVQLRTSRVPYVLRDPNAPVAVLIDSATASSAEVLALAFRGRGNSVLVGASTRGLAAGNRTFPLADGAAMVLTVAATRDREGRIYRGAIAPDVAIGAANAARDPRAGSTQAALDAALEWLRERRAATD